MYNGKAWSTCLHAFASTKLKRCMAWLYSGYANIRFKPAGQSTLSCRALSVSTHTIVKLLQRSRSNALAQRMLITYDPKLPCPFCQQSVCHAYFHPRIHAFTLRRNTVKDVPYQKLASTDACEQKFTFPRTIKPA